MKQREVKIRKADNGYIVKTTLLKESKKRSVEAMIKLMRSMGVYESWQEHQEEDIRRALQSMSPSSPVPEKEEREFICKSLDEVSSHLKKFFETTDSLDETIYL